jgi:chromosome segregation ATPase
VLLQSSITVRGLSFVLNRTTVPTAVFPVDISEAIVEGQNRIVFSTLNVSIPIDVEVVPAADPTAALQKIVKEQKLMTHIEGDTSATEICPMTRRKIIWPGRGENCRHAQCFDLATFLAFSRTKCPVCGIPLSLDDLRYDAGYLHPERVIRDVSSGLGQAAGDLSIRSDSINQAVHKSKTKVDQFSTRPAQLEQYVHDLSSAKSRIAKAKTALETDINASLRDMKDEETNVTSVIEMMAEKQKRMAHRKSENDQFIQTQKGTIKNLEFELARVQKRSEWAEAVLQADPEHTTINRLRDDLIATVNSLDACQLSIRNTRASVFSHQQHLVDLANTFGPIRVRQNALLSRIEEGESDDSYVELQSRMKDVLNRTRAAAVAEQKLVIERNKIEKRIAEARNGIEETRAAKAEVMERLLPLRVGGSTALESIRVQAEQYQTALHRRRELFSSSNALKHNSIARELELKVERDMLTRESELIGDQMRLIEEELDRQKREIESADTWLRANIVSDDTTITPEQVTDEFILNEIIGKIKAERELAARLENDRKPDSTVDSGVGDEFKAKIDARSERISNSLRDLTAELELLRGQIQDAEDEKVRQREQHQIQRRTLIQSSLSSPKVLQICNRVSQLEGNLERRRQKCEKKRGKRDQLDSEFRQLVDRLDLPHNQVWLHSDLCDRIERSANWLLSNIKGEQKKWREATTRVGVGQALNEWDGKIVSASVNEADDLLLRASINSASPQ